MPAGSGYALLQLRRRVRVGNIPQLTMQRRHLISVLVYSLMMTLQYRIRQTVLDQVGLGRSKDFPGLDINIIERVSQAPESAFRFLRGFVVIKTLLQIFQCMIEFP